MCIFEIYNVKLFNIDINFQSKVLTNYLFSIVVPFRRSELLVMINTYCSFGQSPQLLPVHPHGYVLYLLLITCSTITLQSFADQL